MIDSVIGSERSITNSYEDRYKVMSGIDTKIESETKVFFKRMVITLSRRSHQRCSMKKGVLRNFTKFTAKHLCQSLLFNTVAGVFTGVFLWLLWNFLEHLFCRTPLDDCFCLCYHTPLVFSISVTSFMSSCYLSQSFSYSSKFIAVNS